MKTALLFIFLGLLNILLLIKSSKRTGVKMIAGSLIVSLIILFVGVCMLLSHSTYSK